MPIPNYIRPQLTIEQNLERLDASVVNRLNAVVVGPQYKVVTYDASAPDSGTTFASAGQVLAYPDLGTGQVPDTTKTRVFARAVEAALASIATGTKKFKLTSLDEPHVVQLQDGGAPVPLAGTSRDDTVFRGRDVQVGDVFRFTPATGGNAGYRRKVVALRGVASASSVGAPAESSYNPSALGATAVVEGPLNADFDVALGTGAFSGLVKGAVYQGKYGDFFTVRVTTAGAPGTAVLSLRSASGLYDADNVPTTDASGDYAVAGTYFDGQQIIISKESARDLALTDVIQFQLKGAYVAASGVAGLFAVAGTYTGPKNTTYLVRVVEGGALGTAKLQISDTAGIDVAQSVTPAEDTPFSLGTYGLTFTVDTTGHTWNGGFKRGDIYTIAATAAAESTTSFDKVVLDGPAVDITGWADTSILLNTEHRLEFSGEIGARDVADFTPAWVSSATGVTTRSGLALEVDARTTGYKWVAFADGVGTLHVQYRALVPPAAGETFFLVSTASEAVALVGPAVLDNTLGYGVAQALHGAQGRPVYVRRTAGETLDDFNAAFVALENSDLFYALAILSNRADVKLAAAQHADAMSAPEIKHFRRVYLATESPGQYAVLQKKSDGSNFTATVSSYSGQNIRVRCEESSFLSLGLVSGDILRFEYAVDGWGDETWTEYKIASVLNDQELLLQAGPDTPVSPAMRFELWKADTGASQATYVAQASAAINSRRAVNVWADKPMVRLDSGLVQLPIMFIAAEVAGLRTALYPQQGLTHTEISSVTSAPSMYSRFTRAQLDQAAASGTFIITQDIESSAIYIRHQLTTRTDSGSLYYEDSVGVNLDSISFEINDVLTNLIGKKNVNQQTLGVVKNRILAILDAKVENPPTADVGPALVAYDSLDVAVDATLRDTINVSADLVMPLPLNQIKVKLFGSVSL